MGKLKSSALAIGLVGLLGVGRAGAEEAGSKLRDEFDKMIYLNSQSTAPVVGIEDYLCGRIRKEGPASERFEGLENLDNFELLENPSKEKIAQVRKYLNMAFNDVYGSGMSPQKPKLAFVKSKDELRQEIDVRSRIYVVADVKHPAFKNGGPNFAVQTTKDGLTAAMDPLILSLAHVDRSPYPSMALYKAMFYSLVSPQLADNALKEIALEKPDFSSDEEYSDYVTSSLAYVGCLNHQVVLSMWQGLLAQNGPREGITKDAINYELRSGEGLFRPSCQRGHGRARLFEDHRTDPGRLYGILEGLIRQRVEKGHRLSK